MKLWNGKPLIGWTKDWAEENEAWYISRHPWLKKELKIKIPKLGDLPKLSWEDWQEVMNPESRRLDTSFLVDHFSRDNLMLQLATAIEPRGVLYEASVELKKDILSWFLDKCTEICKTDDLVRFPLVYEKLRDCLSNIRRDGVEAAYYLRCTAIDTLTNVLIKLNVPLQDTRLTKLHVEFLFRMLNGTFVDLVYPELHPGEKAESKLKRYDHSKEVAARCLLLLENAYPGFLALEAGSLVQCMLQDSTLKSRQDGHPLVLLTAATLGNVCNQYQRQQQQQLQEEESTKADPPVITSIACGNLESEVLKGSKLVKALALAPEYPRAPMSVSNYCSLEGELWNRKSAGNSVDEQNGDEKTFYKEGKGINVVVGGPFMLFEQQLPSSPTSTTHQTLESSSTREGSVSSDAQSSNWDIPELTAMPLLVSKDIECPELDSFALSKLLKKFKVPAFGNDGLCVEHPRYYITDDVKQSLKKVISFFVSRAIRGNAETIKVLASNLPCILETADISPTQTLSIANTLLRSGNSTLLRAVLSMHDQAPNLFGKNGSGKLVDRMFRLINELECPQDQKLDALTWILRLHASQRFHNRETLYLADSWRQLLLRQADSMQVAVLKIKGLSACLAVGIGDPSIVCHNVLLWNGFDPSLTNKRDERMNDSAIKLRTMTYALRLLYHAIEVSDSDLNLNPDPNGNEAASNRLRLRACVIVSTMVAIAIRPQLVPAVDRFLDSCDSDVSFLFLRAFSGLLSAKKAYLESNMHRAPSGRRAIPISRVYGLHNMWISNMKTVIGDRLQVLFGSSTMRKASTTHTIQVIQMPSTVGHHAADLATWLSTPRTWEQLVPKLLKQDPLAYQTLLFKCTSMPSVSSYGPQCALEDDASLRYKEAHPMVGDTLLGGCRKESSFNKGPTGDGVQTSSSQTYIPAKRAVSRHSQRVLGF